MSFINRSTRHLLVTSVFSVGEYGHFAHEFRAEAYGVAAELIDTTDDADPGALPASYFLWRHDYSPALPNEPGVGSFVAELATFLEVGHAAIVAVLAPGQALSTAPALLIGHDGALWLGTAAALLADPGAYQVRPFDEGVLELCTVAAKTASSGLAAHGG